MSKAFKCDRCENTVSGDPSLDLDVWTVGRYDCEMYELCESCADLFEQFMDHQSIYVVPDFKRRNTEFEASFESEPLIRSISGALTIGEPTQTNTGSLYDAYDRMSSDE